MNQLQALWETAQAALLDYHAAADLLPRGEPRAISTDYVLTRSDMERLLVGPVDVGSEHEGGVTITLHPEARMLVDLIVHAELTDPRGVTDARLNRLRVAIHGLLQSERPYGGRTSLLRESLDSLATAYHSVFVGS